MFKLKFDILFEIRKVTKTMLLKMDQAVKYFIDL